MIQACFTEDASGPNPGDAGETACVTVEKTWVPDGPSGDIQL